MAADRNRSSPLGEVAPKGSEGSSPAAPTPQSVASRLTAPLKGSSVLALTLLLTACATPPDLPAGPAPLDPIAFFTGTTRGTGTLDPIIGAAVPITVESEGTPVPGGLRLVQRIREGDKPERTRVWTIEDRKDGFYTGTLTDAEGMVIMYVVGPRANIAYETLSGLSIRQQLALQPDGRTLHNRLRAYKYGLRVAVLNEVITR